MSSEATADKTGLEENRNTSRVSGLLAYARERRSKAVPRRKPTLEGWKTETMGNAKHWGEVLMPKAN